MILKNEVVIQILITGEILNVYEIKNNRILNEFRFNLIDDDFKSGLFSTLLKHWSDNKILIYERDLKFLRKIGVRV